MVSTCLTAQYGKTVPEWISAPFVSPGKGGTAQYGIPRQGDDGGGVEWGVTSGGENLEAPLLSREPGSRSIHLRKNIYSKTNNCFVLRLFLNYFSLIHLIPVPIKYDV